MILCDEMHPPLRICPSGTRFQFHYVLQKECFLHPYHAPPTWQGYCQYDEYYKGVLVHCWQGKWPIFQVFNSMFEAGRMAGYQQAQSQDLTGGPGIFAGVDFTSALPTKLRDKEVSTSGPSSSSRPALNPMAENFKSEAGPYISGGYNAKGKGKEVATSVPSSPEFDTSDRGNWIVVEEGTTDSDDAIGANAETNSPSSVYLTPPSRSRSVVNFAKPDQTLDEMIDELWNESDDDKAQSDARPTKSKVKLKETIDQLEKDFVTKNMERWKADLAEGAENNNNNNMDHSEIKPEHTSENGKSSKAALDTTTGEGVPSEHKSPKKASVQSSIQSLNPYGVARALERSRVQQEKKAKKKAKKQARKQVENPTAPLDNSEPEEEAQNTPSNSLPDDTSPLPHVSSDTTNADTTIPTASSAELPEETAKTQGSRPWTDLFKSFGFLTSATDSGQPDQATDSAQNEEGPPADEEWPSLTTGAKPQNKKKNKKRSKKASKT